MTVYRLGKKMTHKKDPQTRRILPMCDAVVWQKRANPRCLNKALVRIAGRNYCMVHAKLVEGRRERL